MILKATGSVLPIDLPPMYELLVFDWTRSSWISSTSWFWRAARAETCWPLWNLCYWELDSLFLLTDDEILSAPSYKSLVFDRSLWCICFLWAGEKDLPVRSSFRKICYSYLITSILVAYKSFLIFPKKCWYLAVSVKTCSKSFSILCSFLQVGFFLYHCTLDFSN